MKPDMPAPIPAPSPPPEGLALWEQSQSAHRFSYVALASTVTGGLGIGITELRSAASPPPSPNQQRFNDTAEVIAIGVTVISAIALLAIKLYARRLRNAAESYMPTQGNAEFTPLSQE